MLPRLTTLAPTISEAELLGVGATGFRALVSASALPSVLEEYASSLGKVFIMSAILAAVASVSALGVEWKNIKKVKVATRTNVEDKGRLDEPTTLHLEGQWIDINLESKQGRRCRASIFDLRTSSNLNE